MPLLRQSSHVTSLQVIAAAACYTSSTIVAYDRGGGACCRTLQNCIQVFIGTHGGIGVPAEQIVAWKHSSRSPGHLSWFWPASATLSPPSLSTGEHLCWTPAQMFKKSSCTQQRCGARRLKTSIICHSRDKAYSQQNISFLDLYITYESGIDQHLLPC